MPDANDATRRPKIEYVIFDMDGDVCFPPSCRRIPGRSYSDAGLLIDSERVYTDVTSASHPSDGGTEQSRS